MFLLGNFVVEGADRFLQKDKRLGLALGKIFARLRCLSRVQRVKVRGPARYWSNSQAVRTIVERGGVPKPIVGWAARSEGSRQRSLDRQLKSGDLGYSVALLDALRIESFKLSNATLQPFDAQALLLDAERGRLRRRRNRRAGHTNHYLIYMIKDH